MKRLAVALLGLALAGEASAQQAVIQDGTVLQNSPVMFRGDRHVRQGAGAAGDTAGKMITTGFGVVGGICDFTNTTENSPVKMCLDAATGSVIYNGVSYPPTIGSGNVSGPGSTTINEITSWNSTVGQALRSGAAQATDSKTGGITADAAGLAAFSKSGVTAASISQAISGSGSYANYDALRGVAVANIGSTVVNVTGVAGYLRNQVASTGPGQNAVSVFGMGTCEIDNCATWGINTVLMDAAVRGAAVLGARGLANELDFNIMSANTVAQGLLLIGDSLTQPANSNGFVCAPLGDPGGVIASPIHWTSCILTENGAATFGLSLGAMARSGTSVASQPILFHYFDAAAVAQTAQLVISGPVPQTLSSSISISTSGDYYFPATHGIYAGGQVAVNVDGANNLVFAGGTFTSVTMGVLGTNSLSLAGTNITLSPSVGNAVIVGQRLKLQTLLVANLPTCNAGAQGSMVWVTDSNTAVFNAAVAGGGANVIIAGCDGAGWKVH